MVSTPVKGSSQHDQGDGIQARLVDREHGDRGDKQGEDDDECRHGLFAHFESCHGRIVAHLMSSSQLFRYWQAQ